jgi:hypothetical protein
VRLVFIVEAGLWFVSDGRHWFQVEWEADIDLLATLLPLDVMLRMGTESAVFQGGRASVESADRSVAHAAIAVSFRDAAGTHLRDTTILVTDNLLRQAAWTQGAYADGWLSTMARLSFEGIAELQLRLYLPELTDTSNKELGISINGEDVRRLAIPRNEITSVVAWRGGPGARVHLQLFADYSEPTTPSDDRLLGFFVVELLADGAPLLMSAPDVET